MIVKMIQDLGKRMEAKIEKMQEMFFFVFFFKVYLFLAVLGLCGCTWAFSSCGEWVPLLIAVCRLLIVVASLVVEHGL